MSHPSARDAGFTIIEVLVATLILTIGALATFGLLSTGIKNTERAKATQVAQDRAQQELEALRNLTNEELALTSTPPQFVNPLNPDYRVDAASARFALTRQPLGNYQNLVVNGGRLYGKSGPEGVISSGVVEPGPTAFTSGDVSGEVYRYVVWRNDEACGESCPGEQDYKQIIVAVKLDTPSNQAAERGYVEVQSDFIDPTDSAKNDPLPNSNGEVVTAQQFFLSDTSCAASGTTSRPEGTAVTADHILHNTLGTCADGSHTGKEQGAPDALLLGGPPDSAPSDPNSPPLYDYSHDTYLGLTSETDKGVQILRDDTSGCHYTPTGTTNPQAQVHRWVTDPLEADFTLTETVTLEFFTRAPNDEPYSGKLCVYLFKRHEEGSPLKAVDTRFFDKSNTKNDYWSYTGVWPQFVWKNLKLEMDLSEAPYTIPAGDRLGVALSVERSASGTAAMPIMYDHPNEATRIEVDTTTPINGG